MSSLSDSELPVSDLITVAQAIKIIDTTPVSQRSTRVPLADAQGLRLAEDLVADRDYPPFRKSLMDGYAVRSADVTTVPVELACIGEIAAGQSATQELGSGQAMAIMTGAPMPAGADGVVPVEEVERRAAVGQQVRILRATTPGRYIAQRGSDCPAGTTILSRGTLFGPQQIAAAASVGASRPLVFARPRVAVLATGDELVPVGDAPGDAHIRNSNNPMLVALLQKLGCDVTDLGPVKDQPTLIRAAIEKGMAFDALFITGGMSMGEYDFVPQILQEIGASLKITKLRIKPGKPFVFGISPTLQQQPTAHHPQQTTFIFGLPGNPVSAFVCTLRFASRLLTRLAGGTVEERWLSGRLDAGLPANGPREFYQPAVRTVAPGSHSTQSEFATIHPLGWTGSADLFTLAKSNVLLVRAENDPAVPKGTVVRVLEM